MARGIVRDGEHGFDNATLHRAGSGHRRTPEIGNIEQAMRKPFSCNRYLLIGLYTLLATLAYFIYLAMYIVNELQGV
ncbi:MAG: hypothetical protein IH827_06335 [Myxococcales bacterium]|nr:hypothetical protein [Myxococcales bacterium]